MGKGCGPLCRCLGGGTTYDQKGMAQNSNICESMAGGGCLIVVMGSVIVALSPAPPAGPSPCPRSGWGSRQPIATAAMMNALRVALSLLICFAVVATVLHTMLR